MTREQKATWLAYNRRIGIMLEPSGQQSTKMYPNDMPSAQVLWQRHEPSFKAVSAAAEATTVSMARTDGAGVGGN